MTDEDFDAFVNSIPESKLELIDGQLIVGNGLIATKLLLREILKGWSIAAGLALIDRQLCWQALQQLYPEAPFATDDHHHTQVQAWATQFTGYHPEDLSAGGEGEDCRHHWIRQFLSDQIRTASHQVGGLTLGRDFVMRLGENGFTPDISFFFGPPLNRLHEYYLEGPAELVIEVTRPTHVTQDREVKRRYYEAGGVPEYWIIDPQQQQIEFLRLINGRYQPQQPASNGHYRWDSIPSLVFFPAQLWKTPTPQQRSWELSVFEVLYREESRIVHEESGLQYGDVPFQPRVALEPVPISFIEFISWCPEAKIEGGQDRLEVGDTRHFLGLALMTVGILETVKLLPPRDWVNALIEADEKERNEATRKAEWWQIARQAAVYLREKFGAERVAVMGDLVKPQPLNYWSTIDLIGWGMADREANWELYQQFEDPRVYVVSPDDYLAGQSLANNEVVDIDLS
jgi:Uma2 family endonuclease